MDQKSGKLTSWYGKPPTIFQGFIHPKWRSKPAKDTSFRLYEARRRMLALSKRGETKIPQKGKCIPKSVTGWWFQTLFIFIPIWGNDPICLYDIFQMGWNHQLGEIILPETNSEFTPENGCLEYYSSFWDDGLFSRANCVMVNSPLIWHCRGSLRFPWWKNSEILRCSRCEFQRGYLFHIHYKLTHFALVDSWLFDVGISCLTSPGTKYPRTWNMKFQVISLI